MQKDKYWLKESKKTITKLKLVLGELASNVRSDQFKIFSKNINITPALKVLDVGVSSEEDIKGTNLFDKYYPYPQKVTLATIEDSRKLKKIYPLSKIVKVVPKKKLPFKDGEFDVVVSWAVLEHVGGYEDQEFFLNELLRVGKKIFVTTPYRGCVYEPHTGFFLLHWLPLEIFRRICHVYNNKFWATEENLNPLYVRDILQMKLNKGISIQIYKMLKILPSHLILSNNKL